MEDTFHTIEDVARKLQISVSTVRKLIRSGELEAFQVGKQWRITEQAFNEYVKRSQGAKH